MSDLSLPAAQGPFVHLRVRSAYSLLEGAVKAGEVGALAARADMPAVGITDRANLFGALEFSQLTKDKGVQPIVGCALPVSGIGGGRPESWAREPTVVLLAQNEAGWRNLAVLSSKAYLDSDDEPCVRWSEVAAHAEGLILLSGGPDGPVDPLFATGKGEEGRAALALMAAAFPDRFYVELQRHGAPAEARAEPGLVGWAYDHDVPLVATNDVQYATPDMYEAHDALLCIADGTFIGETDRRRVTPEHWFKPSGLMRELFADLPEACDNTIDIARRCAFLVNKRDPVLPRFPTAEGRTEEQELEAQAREGLKARLAAHPLAAPEAEYWARLEREVGVIARMGFAGYFLIVSDFMKEAKRLGIPVGPGRGSGASSIVAWSLLITGMDPIRYGLIFERFLNPERVSMPDFDIDFCQDRREEVIRYVQGKYGADRVAQIITFGTLQARAVVRDTGRVMQLPLGLVDRLAKMVPANPANPVTLAKALEIEPRLQQARNEDQAVGEMLDVALKLEGLYRNASTHAAGVVIGDRPLVELTPLYRDPRSDLPATQFNMKWVESAGLVKFDFLGLKTLTVIDRALRMLARQGVHLDIEALPLDDKPTYDLLASSRSLGVFQLESQGMRDILRQLRPSSLEEITALISLYRPGPMESIPEYVECKMGRKPVDMPHPLLEPVLRDTYGVFVYQEQVMQAAQILAGYSLGEADLLRRAMGKKKKEEMDQQRARFLSGAAERGVSAPTARLIFDRMEKFAGYGFNKGHAAPYALIAYQTAYLKANHPVEFFAASMSLDCGNTDKLALFVQDAKNFGVTVRPPDINRSRADFDVENGEVLYALGAVKSVGQEAMKDLVAIRERDGAFRDLFDLSVRVEPRILGKRPLETLAKAGAFDSLNPNRAQVVAAAESLCAYSQASAEERVSSQASLFGGVAEAPRPKLPVVQPWPAADQLDQELAAVGFYLTGHPLEEMADILKQRRTTSLAEALALAREGHEAFRMAGVVRRRQERSSGKGERFAFVALSDPTGEFEVMFPPEQLRRCRDVLEAGRAVILKVRASGKDGEVRFFGDDAEPIEASLERAASGAIRIYLTGPQADADALRRRLEHAESKKGGEVRLVAALEGGREVELRLPGVYRLDAALRGALKTAPGVELVEDVAA